MTEKKNPEIIEDTDLDEASGGLLLPAVQKVREAAATDGSAATVRIPAISEVGVTK